MKHIILGFLCLYGSICHCQVYKLKASSFYLDTTYGESKIPDGDWEKTNMLVVVNLDKRVIKTYGDSAASYDVVMLDPPIKNKNNDVVLVFHTIDDGGNNRYILLTVFKDHDPDHWATMRIKNPIADIVLRLKKEN